MTLVVTETPQAARTLRNNGRYAYTIETVDQIDSVPYYYLCALSDITRFVNPMLAYRANPREFAPLSLI